MIQIIIDPVLTEPLSHATLKGGKGFTWRKLIFSQPTLYEDASLFAYKLGLAVQHTVMNRF